MKKGIALLLSLFAGIFGFTVIDKTIEERVSNLEVSVSSQQEEIESLHHRGKYSTTLPEPITYTRPIDSSTTGTGPDSEPVTQSGDVYEGFTFKQGVVKNKHMFRLYSNGSIEYIPSGLNPYFTTAYHPDPYAEYFAYLTSSSAVVSAIDTESESYSYYDADYNIQTTVKSRQYAIITVSATGHTDPVFAGKNVSINTYIRLNMDNTLELDPITNTAVISDDGSFTVVAKYKTNPFRYVLGSYYGDSSYNIESLSIS